MIRRDGDLTPRRWHLSTSRANVMVGATRLTLMAERLAFVSISARPAPDGRAGRAASGARCGGFGSKETHPCLNPSCKFRRSGSRRAMALARKPDPRVCGSASIPSLRYARARPVQRYWIALVDPGKATASRVKTIVCTRPTSSEVLPAKDTKRPCGVKQMLELKRRAPRSAYPGTCFPLG